MWDAGRAEVTKSLVVAEETQATRLRKKRMGDDRGIGVNENSGERGTGGKKGKGGRWEC